MLTRSVATQLRNARKKHSDAASAAAFQACSVQNHPSASSSSLLPPATSVVVCRRRPSAGQICIEGCVRASRRHFAATPAAPAIVRHSGKGWAPHDGWANDETYRGGLAGSGDTTADVYRRLQSNAVTLPLRGSIAVSRAQALPRHRQAQLARLARPIIVGQMMKGSRYAAQVSLDSLYRLIVFCCGATMGVGLLTLAVVSLDRGEVPRAISVRRAVDDEEATAVISSAAAAVSGIAGNAVDDIVRLDALAKCFIRKNSRHELGQAYTFVGREPLGAGAFGEVYHAVHKRTGIHRALKRVEKTPGAAVETLALREVEAMRLVDHPNICRLVEYFEAGRNLWLVMELCRGHELCSRLLELPRGMSEPEAAQMMAQMLRATLHCHAKQLVHRDLKPENFMLEDGELKLIDFGFATPAVAVPAKTPRRYWSGAGSFAASAPGTLMYMSPQMMLGAPPATSDDMWSLGVILYIMLTGQFPFSTNDDRKFQEVVSRGMLQSDVQKHIEKLSASHAAKDLVGKLLSFDTSKRLTAEAALRHPFLRGSDSADVKRDSCFSCAGRAGELHRPLEPEAVHELLQQFTSQPRLKRLVAAAASRLLLTDCGAGASQRAASFERARATFLALEKTGAGYIPTAALQDYLQRQGLDIPAAWLEVSSASCRGAGGWSEPGISHTSFMAAMLDEEALSDQRLVRNLFELLDADRDGFISAKDLQSRLGDALPASECELAIDEALELVAATSRGAASPPGVNLSAFAQMLRRGRSSLR
eukprot:TRINITY_DN26127_c0_g2_i1.p1 TRINITY_DN26127_c0_g2~~TRINITY_DN26127_c0_g2_i1.p1  ORF type:complete len:762 (+),score=179.89 TRINITY_DN26127_c0_g2_i1:142-2427(+)